MAGGLGGGGVRSVLVDFWFSLGAFALSLLGSSGPRSVVLFTLNCFSDPSCWSGGREFVGLGGLGGDWVGGCSGFLSFSDSLCFLALALWDAGARWRLLLQHAVGLGSEVFLFFSCRFLSIFGLGFGLGSLGIILQY